LIVSDTGAGREDTVASGPTFDPAEDGADATSVIRRYKLEARLPESILRAVRSPARNTTLTSQHALRKHHVLLDNEDALASAAEAARSLGFVVEIARDAVEQPIVEGCGMLLSQLLDLRRRTLDPARRVCLVSGGEFACPVRGGGTGGRNAESALRWAIELDALAKTGQGFIHAVALSAGTDGIDGNSPAAGAISDETTVGRARRLNLDAQHSLDESDAYNFFNALGDAVITGPTGTNVRDVRILLAC
jgi:glycerate 2-kinase